MQKKDDTYDLITQKPSKKNPLLVWIPIIAVAVGGSFLIAKNWTNIFQKKTPDNIEQDTLAAKEKKSATGTSGKQDDKKVNEATETNESTPVTTPDSKDIQYADATTINFRFNSAELTSDAKARIDAFIKEFSGKNLTITGYTCTIGEPQYNYLLSGYRAENVKKYIQKKYPDVTITTKAMGSDNPIADNSSESGRIKNRRAEIQ